MEQMLRDIKDKVDNLEYKEIKPLKEEISKLKTNYAVNTKITEQCTETNKALNDTLTNVSSAMIELKLSMEHSNQKVDELGNKMDNMQEKFNKDVGTLNERVTGIDNKTKIDTSNTISEIFKNGLFWLFGGGLLTVLMAYIMSNIN